MTRQKSVSDVADCADEQEEKNARKNKLRAPIEFTGVKRFVRAGPVAGRRVGVVKPSLHHRIVGHVAWVEPFGGTVMIEGHSTPLPQMVL